MLGSEESVIVDANPILFQSPVMYYDPNKENLPDDNYDSEDDDLADKIGDEDIK